MFVAKITTWLHGTNLCISCTSSVCFATSSMQLWNDPKCTQILWNGPNISLGSNGVDWCIRFEKSRRYFVARSFALIALVQPVLRRVSCSYETIENAPKHYETHQNPSLGSNGVDQVHSLRKITMWLRGMNFYINCTSLARYAPSFV